MAKARAYVADLPAEMSDAAMEKLYAWGKTNEKFDVRMNANGSMTLVVERKKAGTARDHQRNLRTLLNNWGVALPQRQAGWLRIIGEEMGSMEHAPAASDPPDESEEEWLAAAVQEEHACDGAGKPTAPAEIPVSAPSAMVGLRLRPPSNLLTNYAEVVRAY